MIAMDTNKNLTFGRNGIESKPIDLKITSNKYSLKSRYHNSEIDQNEGAYKVVKFVLVGGFLIIVAGIILSYYGNLKTGILSSVAGVLTELISGTVMIFFNMTGKSKQNYFNQLSLDEERQSYISLIERTDLREENKMKLLNKLLDSYCSRSQQISKGTAQEQAQNIRK